MSSVRLRRLQSDYEAVRRLVRGHPRIEIEGVAGNPPEKYRLVINVQSLRRRGDEIMRVHAHRLEITLPAGYPRDPPFCRMLTPVFHPNIAPHAVCVGDHWTAAESLDGLIQRVGEMLAFQSYNTKSPLNGKAAQWVEEHLSELPIDRTEFFLDMSSDHTEVDTGACANCGATTPNMQRCDKSHTSCEDCAVHCETCEQLLCLACGVVECPTCNAEPEVATCSNCGSDDVKGVKCKSGHLICPDCLMICDECERLLCFTCGSYPCPTCSD